MIVIIIFELARLVKMEMVSFEWLQPTEPCFVSLCSERRNYSVTSLLRLIRLDVTLAAAPFLS